MEMGMNFFKPSSEMADWLVEYANGRFIIDVGAGTGHIVKLLTAKGAKCIAIEPMQNYMLWTKMQMMNEDAPRIHLLPFDIEDQESMVKSMLKDNKAILFFCRPCHSGFIENGLDMLPEGCEALYITVPKNLEEYRDLGKYHDEAVLLEHKGGSADNEVVYSIKKDSTTEVSEPNEEIEESTEEVEEFTEEEEVDTEDRKISGKIKVTTCGAVGGGWANCIADSEHDVVPCPEGEGNKLDGVWVVGAEGTPVKLLKGEYIEIQ